MTDQPSNCHILHRSQPFYAAQVNPSAVHVDECPPQNKLCAKLEMELSMQFSPGASIAALPVAVQHPGQRQQQIAAGPSFAVAAAAAAACCSAHQQHCSLAAIGSAAQCVEPAAAAAVASEQPAVAVAAAASGFLQTAAAAVAALLPTRAARNSTPQLRIQAMHCCCDTR